MTTLLVKDDDSALPVTAGWRTVVLGVVAYAFILRVVFSACVELMPEEAYYWNYSRHLDIGYLDHPPLVAWLIRAGTTLFGNTEFGVRFGALCCGVTASFFIYRLTREVFGQASALAALIFAQVLPYFFMSGMLMTPDAPLAAAWAASLFYLERALVGGRSGAWLGVGLAMGIGMISKYTIGMVGLAALIFMIADVPSRRWFRRWEPYAAVLIAAAVFSPVIVWNAQHDWASFAFQTSRRLAERPQFSLHKLIGAAIVLITPVGVFGAWAAFFSGGRPAARDADAAPATGRDGETGTTVDHAAAAVSDGSTATFPAGDAAVNPLGSAATVPVGAAPRTRTGRLLQIALLVPLVVFFCFSLRHEVKLDWTGGPWTAALPLMGFGYAAAAIRGGLGSTRRQRRRRWLRAAWPPMIGLLLLVYGAGLFYLVFGIPGVGYTAHTELIPIGWRELGRQVDAVTEDIEARNGAGVVVVGMDRYAIASELAFYSRDQSNAVGRTSAAHLFGDMGLMYEQWFPPGRQEGKTLLLVGGSPASLDGQHLSKYVGELGPVHEWPLARDGRIVRHYYYRVAYRYRP